MIAGNRIRTALIVVAMAMLGLTATSANAGTITYVGITGDADSGISAENTYTHTLDFGTGTPGALINGVQFDPYNAAANGTLNFNREAVTGLLSEHGGNAGHNVSGGLADLLTDMYYNGNNAVDGVTTWTLSGLTAGYTYHTRIYTRQWGAGGTRHVTFVFDPDGAGPVSDSTEMINQDDATSVGFANGNDAYYINYEFTAVAGEDLVITLTQDIFNYSWHLYGLSNQEFATLLASSPVPADGATDVPRDSDLSWTPGVSAVTHDVYVGESFEEVDTATTPTDPGLDATSYDPGRLELGKTYYWRVDEVNGAPDNTVFKGNVWSFTVEPLAYAIEGVIASTNGTAQAGALIENTVNGSGLNEQDQHSTESEDMWLGVPGADPLYLQYEFDGVYKLHEMLVWNYNVQFELVLGFGIKDVTVEYSADGAEWTVLGDVALAQATANASYEANTTIDFGGVAAKYVRLMVNSGQGMMGQFGLSEVRFMFIPAVAREPEPANGAVDVSVDTTFAWRAGRDSVSHDVYFGTDAEALALAGTAEGASFDPGALDLDTAYFWQIDEIQDAESWAGPVWTFTTQAYLVVEDFESYDDEENRIYQSWVDGYGVSSNGSQVGNLESPFAEQTIVKSGSQSMPLFYDNAGTSMSEAELTLAQDWTKDGVKSLSLFFRGASENVGGQLYVKINNTKISYDADPVTLSRAIWHPWTIDLSAVGGNLSNVSSLTIGVEGAGATGIVYIDAIRLYPSLDPHAAFNHIPVISATATSSLGGNFNRMDALCIDGSGLNPDGSHTVTPDGFMWLNNGTFTEPHDLEPEIVFDLGAVYSVDTMLVWNYNEVGDFTKRGIGTADILIAGADGVFSSLIENQAFDEAPGTGDVDFHQTIDLAGAKARFIKLDISGNHGGDNDFVGLSEVQFEGTLSP